MLHCCRHDGRGDIQHVLRRRFSDAHREPGRDEVPAAGALSAALPQPTTPPRGRQSERGNHLSRVSVEDRGEAHV